MTTILNLRAGLAPVAAADVTVDFGADSVEVLACEGSRGHCGIVDSASVNAALMISSGATGTIELAQITYRPLTQARSTPAVSVNIAVGTAGSSLLARAANRGQAVQTRQANPTIMGDVNCDERVNILDALVVAQYAVGIRTDSGGCPLPNTETINLAAADVDASGKANILDALLIAQCGVQLVNTFCPELAPDLRVTSFSSERVSLAFTINAPNIVKFVAVELDGELQFYVDPTTTTTIFEGLLPNQAHRVTLRGVDDFARQFGGRQELAFTTAHGEFPPGEPILFVRDVDSSAITLGWGHGDGLDPDDTPGVSYVVEVDGQPQSGRLSETTKSYRFASLPSNTTFSFVVAITDADGNTVRSRPFNATTRPATPPPPPPDTTPPGWNAGAQITSTDLVQPGAVELSWCCALDYDSYDVIPKAFDIYLRAPGQSSWTRVATQSATNTGGSVGVSGLVEGQVYSVRIVAIDHAGNRSEAMEYGGVVASGPPIDGPTNPAADPNPGQPDSTPPAPTDTTPPVWPVDGVYVSIAETTATVRPDGAVDNVGVVSYRVTTSRGETEYVSPGGSAELTIVTGADTTITIQAVDRAGNVSTDGPDRVVRGQGSTPSCDAQRQNMGVTRQTPCNHFLYPPPRNNWSRPDGANSTAQIFDFRGWRKRTSQQRVDLHSGIDIGLVAGDSAYAVADGEVVHAECLYTAIALDDGSLVMYWHAEHVGLSIGDRVTKGQHIATVLPGFTGCNMPYPAHLHLETYRPGWSTSLYGSNGDAVLRDATADNPWRYLCGIAGMWLSDNWELSSNSSVALCGGQHGGTGFGTRQDCKTPIIDVEDPPIRLTLDEVIRDRNIGWTEFLALCSGNPPRLAS